MPRGVYPRKKKGQHTLPGTPNIKTAAQKLSSKIRPELVTDAQMSTALYKTPSSSFVVQELYQHLNTMVANRAGLLSSQHEAPFKIVDAFGFEIFSTLEMLRVWREKTFRDLAPVQEKAEETSEAQPQQTGVFVPAPPAAATAPIASPPVPFTPTSVQDTLNRTSAPIPPPPAAQG